MCVHPQGALCLCFCLGIFLFVVIIRCISSLARHLLPPQVIKSPLATSSSVFCSSPSFPLRPPTSLSCAAKWTAYITPWTWRGFSHPATSSFPSSFSTSAPRCPPLLESCFLHSSSAVSAFGTKGAPAGLYEKTHTRVTCTMFAYNRVRSHLELVLCLQDIILFYLRL